MEPGNRICMEMDRWRNMQEVSILIPGNTVQIDVDLAAYQSQGICNA